MRAKCIRLAMSAGLALACLQAGAGLFPALAQTPAALAGQVTSAEEGAMEGVLVSAKKTGSKSPSRWSATRTAATASRPTKLEPGTYTIAIRAIGYDLDRPKPSAEVAADKDDERRSQAAQDQESSRPSSPMANGS